jgi:predicted AAA+ superfamily ATPase
MIKRKLGAVIEKRLKHFPAVVLIGPRQVAKTKLAKLLSAQYFDLELEEEKLRLGLQ